MRAFIDTNLWADRLDQREPQKFRRISTWLAETTRNHDVVTTAQ